MVTHLRGVSINIVIHGDGNYMSKLKKVVIVGGGVGGITTALALKRAGVEIEVQK
jgi:NADPH-dependent 2,4-dienoyl-CoA reductase/sulfur reductase-like enzyme